jgi:hypothetical protein
MKEMGMVAHALGRLKQKDDEFKENRSYVVIPSQNKAKTKRKRRKKEKKKIKETL